MAANNTLAALLVAVLSAFTKLFTLALSIRNSGMNMKLSTLKFAERVAANTFPPIATGDFESSKYSALKVNPTLGVGSKFK